MQGQGSSEAAEPTAAQKSSLHLTETTTEAGDRFCLCCSKQTHVASDAITQFIQACFRAGCAAAAAANSLIPQVASQAYLTFQPIAKRGNTSVICTEEDLRGFTNGWH